MALAIYCLSFICRIKYTEAGSCLEWIDSSSKNFLILRRLGCAWLGRSLGDARMDSSAIAESLVVNFTPIRYTEDFSLQNRRLGYKQYDALHATEGLRVQLVRSSD